MGGDRAPGWVSSCVGSGAKFTVSLVVCLKRLPIGIGGAGSAVRLAPSLLLSDGTVELLCALRLTARGM